MPQTPLPAGAGAPRGVGFGAFRAWWLRELSTFLPARLTGMVRARHRLPVVRWHAAGPTVTGRAGTAQDLARWAPRAGRRRSVVLRLPADRVLTRRLVLPAAAARSLDRMLRLEMDRLTPWPADAVHYAARIERRLEGGKIAVAVEIVPKAETEAAVRAVAAARLRLLAIETDEASPDMRIIPVREGAEGGRRRLKLLAVAAVLLFGLGVAGAGGIVGWRLHERAGEVADLRERIAALEPGIAEVQALRAEIETLSDAHRFIDDKRRTLPAASIVLEGASRAVPDTAWLTDLSIDRGTIRLSGYATDAPALIGALSASPGFANVRFLAPSVREAETGQDRFSVGAEIRPALGPPS